MKRQTFRLAAGNQKVENGVKTGENQSSWRFLMPGGAG
jgi:hypothetical protein